MKTKLSIKSIFGALLFELECENNSIKNTLLEAIKRRANLSGAEYNEYTGFLLGQCPSEGSFIVWKKCGKYVVKLKVCEDAKRSSATKLKCRCSKALCLDIQNFEGSESGLNSIRSDRSDSFIYKIGEINEVVGFSEERFNEYSSGIHFFISREMAVKYN